MRERRTSLTRMTNIIVWKNDGRGYWKILRPDHPRADANGYVLEHLLVMEEKIGRCVTRIESVHHLDHNSLNNHPDNLMLFASISEHRRYEACNPPKVLITAGFTLDEE